jgi:tetratricopeptide (TPR) repeat protein
LLWPSNLLFVYPRWHLSTAWPWPLIPLSVLAVALACWSVRGRGRTPLAVALLYLGTLFPALGFVNVYPFVFSFVADHFVYLPSIPIIVAISASVARFRAHGHAGWSRAGAIAIGITLGVLTWRQCQTYANAETLYRTTLERNPACYLCLNNLGTLAVSRGDVGEARDRFEEALRIEPGSAETHNNLANLLVEHGDLTGAIAHYQQSLAIAPRSVIARTNLGIALVRAGRLPEARREFERTLQVMPGYAPAAQNLAVLVRLGVPRSE